MKKRVYFELKSLVMLLLIGALFAPITNLKADGMEEDEESIYDNDENQPFMNDVNRQHMKEFCIGRELDDFVNTKLQITQSSLLSEYKKDGLPQHLADTIKAMQYDLKDKKQLQAYQDFKTDCGERFLIKPTLKAVLDKKTDMMSAHLAWRKEPAATKEKVKKNDLKIDAEKSYICAAASFFLTTNSGKKELKKVQAICAKKHSPPKPQSLDPVLSGPIKKPAPTPTQAPTTPTKPVQTPIQTPTKPTPPAPPKTDGPGQVVITPPSPISTPETVEDTEQTSTTQETPAQEVQTTPVQESPKQTPEIPKPPPQKPVTITTDRSNCGISTGQETSIWNQCLDAQRGNIAVIRNNTELLSLRKDDSSLQYKFSTEYKNRDRMGTETKLDLQTWRGFKDNKLDQEKQHANVKKEFENFKSLCSKTSPMTSADAKKLEQTWLRLKYLQYLCGENEGGKPIKPTPTKPRAPIPTPTDIGDGDDDAPPPPIPTPGNQDQPPTPPQKPTQGGTSGGGTTIIVKPEKPDRDGPPSVIVLPGRDRDRDDDDDGRGRRKHRKEVDCIDCIERSSSSSAWIEGFGMLAGPLAYYGAQKSWASAYSGVQNTWANAYAGTNQAWANAYQAGIAACDGRFNAYLQYNTNRGANPIEAQDAARMSQMCNQIGFYGQFQGGAGGGMNMGGMYGYNTGMNYYNPQYMYNPYMNLNGGLNSGGMMTGQPYYYQQGYNPWGGGNQYWYNYNPYNSYSPYQMMNPYGFTNGFNNGSYLNTGTNGMWNGGYNYNSGMNYPHNVNGGNSFTGGQYYFHP